MPDVSKYDLSFRPRSYWLTVNLVGATVANIKGTARRQEVGAILEEAGGIPAELAWVAGESVTDEQRDARGRLHPQLMGGEYLPDTRPHQVWVETSAGVELESVTGDVISIRASQTKRGIRYRIVNEYGSKFWHRPQQSQAPLTMGQLIALINSTTSSDRDDDESGLTTFYRDMNHMPEPLHANAKELVNFVTVSSTFYPELRAYYEEEAQEWLVGALATEAAIAIAPPEPSTEVDMRESLNTLWGDLPPILTRFPGTETPHTES